MKINDFLTTDLLGKKFLAIKSYDPAYKRDTNELDGYRLNISLQDENSPFYMELITVKVKNTSPTLSVQELSNNKSREVKLKNLKISYFNNNLFFTAEDILPVERG